MASLLRIKNGDLEEVLIWEEVEVEIDDCIDYCISFFDGRLLSIGDGDLIEEGYIYIEDYDVDGILPLGVDTQEGFKSNGYFKLDFGNSYKIIKILSENSYYFEEEQVVIEDLKGNTININISDFSKYSILCYYHKKDEKYYVVEDYDGDDYLYDFIIKDCCRDQYGDLESIAYFENEIEKNKKINI